jgi:hypothetical protein
MKERGHNEDVDLEMRIILMWLLEKWDWDGFIWLRIEIDGSCEYLEWLSDCWFLKDLATWS